MNEAQSVKDRLRNRSRVTGKTMQELLVTYGIERTIYRLSVSPYSEYFTLKGGILLYALFDGNYPRATTDIDLLADHINHTQEDIRRIFTSVFSVKADDPIFYDLNTLSVRRITEFKTYYGVCVSVMAHLERTRIPISIDICFGNVIIPGKQRMWFPAALENEEPAIFAYTVESVIAEKAEAIVSLGSRNSRYKDYYDLYMLSRSFDLEGRRIAGALKATFENRNTSFEMKHIINRDDAADQVHHKRWEAFIRRKHAMIPLKFEEAVFFIEPHCSAQAGS